MIVACGYQLLEKMMFLWKKKYYNTRWSLLLLMWWLLKEPFVLWVMNNTYARSPRIRRANWMSLGMMVTRLAWMAHKLVSSNRPTR